MLIGLGLGLAVTALTHAALAGRSPQAIHGGWTIAARHIGVVLGLIVLVPDLPGRPRPRAGPGAAVGRRDRARLEPAAGVKIGVARDVVGVVEQADRRIPDIDRAFAGRKMTPALEAVRTGLLDELDRAATHAFSRSFLVGSPLALARSRWCWSAAGRSSCEAVVVPSARSRWRCRCAYAAAGGGRYKPKPVADPCAARPWHGAGGVSGLAAQLALSATDGAACRLHVSRESLVLALATRADLEAVRPRDAISTTRQVEAAMRDGLQRAINDATRAGALGALPAPGPRPGRQQLPVDRLFRALQGTTLTW